jgi:hypothetical protein
MKHLLLALNLAFTLLIVLAPASVSAQDSLNVTSVSQFRFWQYSEDIAVSGSYAYVPAGSSGLQILDISSFQNPVLVYSLTLPFSVNHVVVAGQFAYLTADAGTIYAVDVTNPLAPVLAGSFNDGSGLFQDHLVIVGNLLITGDDSPRRLLILDISNPAQPILRSELQTPNYCMGIAVRDSVVYYGTCHDGIHAVDIHNPEAPVEIGSSRDIGQIANIVIQDHFAFASNWWSELVTVLDIANPDSIADLARLSLVGWVEDMAVTDSRLYVSAWDSLYIYDIAAPTNPLRLGSFSHPCTAYGLDGYSFDVVGETICLVTSCNDVVVVNAADPAHPFETGLYSETPARRVTDIEVQGNYLYLPYGGTSDGDGGLLIMNASDPAHLQMAAYRPGYAGFTLAVRDTFAYLCEAYVDRRLDDPGDILTLNIANPTEPESLCVTNLLSIPSCIALSGAYGYVGYWDEDVTVIDMQDPAHPEYRTSKWIPAGCLDLAAADSILLVATYQGLGIYRTTDVDTLEEIETILPDKRFESVAVHNQYVIASAWGDSVFIIDITNLANPVITAWYRAPVAFDLCADSDLVYMACDTAGLYVLDISNPAAPVISGHYNTPGRAEALTVHNNLIYVADYDGIGVYSYTAVTGIKPQHDPAIPNRISLTAYPNPFNSSTTISFTLPQAGEVKMNVYDVLGRDMALTCPSSTLQAGEHHITFDGAALPSGTYFVRLQAGSNQIEQKLLLLK